MAETQMAETQIDATERRPQPVLTASVRRHLGRSLRSFYATALTAPISERMEALLARLQAQNIGQ